MFDNVFLPSIPLSCSVLGTNIQQDFVYITKTSTKWEFYLTVSLLLSPVLLILEFFYSYFPLFSLNTISPLFLLHMLMLYFRKTAFRPLKLSETNLVPAWAHLKLSWWKNFTLIWAEHRLNRKHLLLPPQVHACLSSAQLFDKTLPKAEWKTWCFLLPHQEVFNSF